MLSDLANIQFSNINIRSFTLPLRIFIDAFMAYKDTLYFLLFIIHSLEKVLLQLRTFF